MMALFMFSMYVHKYLWAVVLVVILYCKDLCQLYEDMWVWLIILTQGKWEYKLV